MPVGDGEVTTYTFGTDLYDAMLAAIDGRPAPDPVRDLHLEGRRGRSALQDRAGGRGRPRRRGLLHLRRVREPRGLAAVQALPELDEGAPLPRVRRRVAAVRPAPLRPRPPQDPRGRRRRSGSSAATTSATAYATEWRDTHVRITGPGVWDLKRAFADFWNLNRRRRFRSSERPLLLETASTWEPTIRFHRNVPRLWMFPIRAMYIEAITRASQQRLADHGVLPARPGLRRRPDLRGAARRRRTAADPGQVQPRRRRLDLARLLLPAARAPG